MVREWVLGSMTYVFFTPDSRTLIICRGDAFTFWDVETCREVGTFTWPGRQLSALAFAPDGRTLAVGYCDGTVQLWPWRALLDAR